MSGELYHWLEGINDRAEYVQDQLVASTPVFAVSRNEGILLLGVGLGQSKVFEIYDRHGLAALGNPVDIEKLRQTAIEAAHLEGFNRSPHDVTIRRLISFSLSPSLKDSFESILEPPLIVESVFAELGETPEDDVLIELAFDGKFTAVNDGLSVVSANKAAATQAKHWLKSRLKPHTSRPRVISLLLTMWDAISNGKRISHSLKALHLDAIDLGEKQLEVALLNRSGLTRVRYEPIHLKI